MSETVIKLRRSLLGFRETRSQGAYCAACRLSVPIENHSAMQSGTPINHRPGPSLAGLLLTWLRGAPARPSRGPIGLNLYEDFGVKGFLAECSSSITPIAAGHDSGESIKVEIDNGLEGVAGRVGA
jgi:hypothetical protein